MLSLDHAALTYLSAARSEPGEYADGTRPYGFTRIDQPDVVFLVPARD
jgi:hypothetical protein